MTCAAVFRPEASQAFFARLGEHPFADGCTLEEVKTDRARVEVVFQRAGEDLPAIVIEPVECAPRGVAVIGSLAVHAPDTTKAACPDAVPALARAVVVLEPYPEEAAPVFSRGGTHLAWGVLGLALAGSMVSAIRSLRGGAPTRR